MTIAPPSPYELLALAGATQILVRGAIFARVRRVWPALLACALCVGFWVGAVGGFALRVGPAVRFDAELALAVLLDGAAVALVSLLADAVLARLLDMPPDKEPRP